VVRSVTDAEAKMDAYLDSAGDAWPAGLFLAVARDDHSRRSQGPRRAVGFRGAAAG
jgi:hypothetical protein